ncbi:hypothetical protein [Levilactobacillus lindianensis]|uniref:hypothetical protein n=1 Tax=Levilactobacillus lindianensis TaxID=2486018 RepID=UPI000F7424BD|nr:hypothetical protein [Levilactobacillus lindianensis]
MPSFKQQNTFHFMFDKEKEPLTITPYLGKDDSDPLGIGGAKYGTEIKVEEPITLTANPAITYQQGSGGAMEVSILVWSSRTSGFKKGTKVLRRQTGETFTVTGSAPLTHSQLTYYQLQRNGDDDAEQSTSARSTGDASEQVPNEFGGEDPLGL